jgi:GntR family transcriptional regulator
MDIHIDRTLRIPINDQIKEQIKGLLLTGQLKYGDQLPTIHNLSVELGINFNTVALAYRDLAHEGMVMCHRGKGTFIGWAPESSELQHTRQEKLTDLIEALINETQRLGYERDEVRQAVFQHMSSGGHEAIPANPIS